jgi:signal transduction histidine kinase
MKFILSDKKFSTLSPVSQEEIKEKLFAAERNIANVRILVVLLNTIVFIFLMDKSSSIEGLAWFIIILAFLYSTIIIAFQPYRKYHLLLSSYFTTGSDAVLITLWIIATGSFDSPFYVLWYVSILSIAMRYTISITIIAALIFSALYLLIVLTDVRLFDHLTDTIIRIGYLLFIAALGGFLSKETIDQIEARILVMKSEEEMRKSEAQLKEARDKLEERVKERTKELDESNQQLLRINEDIDNFVYSASHDLKSPIINVESLLEILFEKNPDKNDESVALEEKVKISLERIKQTIHNLAQVARTQKEVYEDISTIKFDDMIREVIIENEEIFRKEDVHVECDFSSAESMICSRSCLKSIIYNFMSNAIKYKSPERTPLIRIKTEMNGYGLKLFISDNGLGINLKENREKLFMIFKRFHTHVEGTGIGLYMVKRLVERNNGIIEVESEVDKGTTFTVTFKKADFLKSSEFLS